MNIEVNIRGLSQTLVSLIVIAFAWPVNAFPTRGAAACPPQQASAGLKFKSDKDGDIGVVPSGFVLPSDGTPVVQGIDVSKYQVDPIFAGVKHCGGEFAYVRLSAGAEPGNERSYRAFWGNAKSAGLLTGPYHHLRVFGPKSHDLHQLQGIDFEALRKLNISHAIVQARLFKSRLIEVLGYDPLTEQTSGSYGGPYLPAMLAVSETPLAWAPEANQRQFSSIYGSAICAWIREFQSDGPFKDQPVILFTKPFIFRDYDLARAPCDLSHLKVWIFYHGRTGDRPLTEKEPIYRKAIDDLCLTGSGENRCVFEQYTSYGGFAVYLTGAGLDLDRYIGTPESLRAMLQRASAITVKQKNE